MHDRLRLNQGEMPEEVQLELLAPWYTQNTSESRTLDFFDAIPKYPFSVTTTIEKSERIEVPFTLRGKKYTAEIVPARIKDAQTGQERLVFPGSREELVERALRFIAVQQIAKTKLTPDLETGRQAVTVFFTLSMLRRHLEGLGHGFRLSAIKEALDILSDTLIEIRLEADDEPGQSKRRRFMKGTILSNYTGDFAEGDSTGEDSRAAMTFHPLATQAILELAYFPINQARVGALKHLDAVRNALKEMKQRGVLSKLQAFDEKLAYAPTNGRSKIINAVWTLYPSDEFVDEIISGSKQMSHARTKVGANKSESRLLPGLQNHRRR